jgi:Zn-dependent oligopeptidase
MISHGVETDLPHGGLLLLLSMPTAAALTQSCDLAIARLRSATQRLTHPRGPRTFFTVTIPLERAVADANDALAVDRFLQDVTAEEDLRDASTRCDRNARAAIASLESPSLYRAVLAAAASDTAPSALDHALDDAWLVKLRLAGAGIPPGRRAEFLALENELDDLQLRFQANLAADDASISLGRRHSKLAVNERTYDFLRTSNDEGARQAYWMAYENRAWQTNVPLFERALADRDRLAHLLDYESWADYRLAGTMADSPMRVEKFLSAAVDQLRVPTETEIANMRAAIAADEKRAVTTLQPWDVDRARSLLARSAVDGADVRRYFPAQHTFDATLEVCHTLFGIDFTRLAPGQLWSPDVVALQVSDSITGTMLGYTYVDLYARPGAPRFTNVTLVPPRAAAVGRNPALAVILGNWSRPAPGDPALLAHDDVVALFEGLGANLSTLLAAPSYETLHDALPFDFGGVAPEVFVNLAWDPAILAQISSDAQTGEAMPTQLAEKLAAARDATDAYATMRLLVLSTIDMQYHSTGDRIDSTAIWAKTSDALLPQLYAVGTHPQVASNRWMRGDDARTYAGAWARMYAQDIYTAFAPSPLDPTVGMRFRTSILARAPGQEPDDAVANFLGRPMNPAAFLSEFTR